MGLRFSFCLAATLCVVAPAWSQTTAPDSTADRQIDDELGGLVGQLRNKLDTIRDGGEQEIPLGELAQELEQARRDIERLAELVLRREITEIRQQSAYAIAVQEIEALSLDLDGAQTRVAGLQAERDRMEAFVAESAVRVDELAQQLIAADDAKRELERTLDGTQAEADQARADLADAVARIASIDVEIDSMIAQYDERTKLFEAELMQANAAVDDLSSELLRQEVAFTEELASKDQDIAVLTARQVKAREALVQALAEMDGMSGQSVTAYEREMLRSAEASSQARTEILDDLGFSRDERGQLMAPDVQFDAATLDATAIEPAAGNSYDDCGGRLELVDRAYLDDQAAEEWQHYLVGTLRFDEAATKLDVDNLTGIVDCLASLADQSSVYFKLIGHTDAKGARSYNQQLSLARAQAVRDVFGDYVAIQPWRLFAQGRGERYPIADNQTETGRELNRRVEVFAVKAIY